MLGVQTFSYALIGHRKGLTWLSLYRNLTMEEKTDKVSFDLVE